MARLTQLTVLVAICAAMPALADDKPDYKTQAWMLLRAGVHAENTQHRATAVRVLSLLPGDADALSMASDALADAKPEVRAAAAMALGQSHSPRAVPLLKSALADKEVAVVLAAARSLLLLNDNTGYEVYYAILSGKRKGKGLVAEQLDTLKDPKKMAEMGFEEGIGFVPFAGIGYSAVKTIMKDKDDSSPVRAAAAKVLADDPDPDAGQTLIETAIGDKSELVRAAAFESLARRNDHKMVEKIAPGMTDEKETVAYTAAVAVIRLSNAAPKPPRKAGPTKVSSSLP